MVRWGDHQGLERWEGGELGVWSLRRPVSRLSTQVSQSSRTFGGGQNGGGGTMKVSMLGEMSSQSVWSHLRCGGAGTEDGNGSRMVMGTWSEPVEGREFSYP